MPIHFRGQPNGVTVEAGGQTRFAVAGTAGAAGFRALTQTAAGAAEAAPAPAEAKPAKTAPKTSGKTVKVIEAPAPEAEPEAPAGDQADDILKSLGL